MAKLVEPKVKKATTQESLSLFLKRHNVSQRGAGTKFWITLLKEQRTETAVITLSNDKTKVYLIVKDEEDNEYHVNLGMHYEALQTLVEYEGSELEIVLAPRVPNPALSESDIAAVETQRGPEATRRIKAAMATEGSSELVLVSYDDTQIE